MKQARVTTIQVRPGKVDEAIRIFREMIVPAAKQQEGFAEVVILSESESGKILVQSYWESVDNRLASEHNGYFETQIAMFGNLLTNLPVRAIFDVSVQE